MTTSNQKKYRVLNLIGKVDLAQAHPKQRMVIKLLKWQPLAEAIRFETDAHCKGAYFLSYQLPGDKHIVRSDPAQESCGYYCPRCGWGNAGSRPKRLKPNELGTEDLSR